MTLKCIIVDDEPRAIEVLKTYTAKLKVLDLAYTCNDALSAYEYLRHNRVDLILLDINMPEIDGFSLMNMITEKPMVIFTTAYSEYALKSYDYSAIDYLHKPIRFERFITSIDRALMYKHNSQKHSIAKDTILNIDVPPYHLTSPEIMFIQGLRNYVKIHCKHGVHILHITLKELEAKLGFVRIHKSVLVNPLHISEYTDNHLKVRDTLLPIGKTYKKLVSHILKTG